MKDRTRKDRTRVDATPLRGCRKPVAALCAALVLAPAAAGAATQLEEVVVTALKRNTSLQETPISISALGGDALVKMGADDFEDYVGKVPGLNLLDNGPGSRRLVIRGVQGAGEAQVGLYYDEVPVTGAPGSSSDAGQRQPDIKMVDIERVEVLRGPQGTLYGSGTMGGTLRVITNKPDAGGFGARVGTDLSYTEHGDMNTKLTGMVNLPLIEDELAVRLVAYDYDMAGYIDNVAYGKDNLNDEQTSGGRVSVRWTPGDRLTLTGMYIQQDTETGGGFSYHRGVGDLKTDTPTRDPFDDDVTIANITGELMFDWGTWMVSYSDYERDVVFNFDSSAPPFPPPYELLVANQPQPLDMTSFETRLSSDGAGPLNWTVGFFTSTRDATLDSNILAAGPDGYPLDPPNYFFLRDDETSLEQKSVFGEVSYDFTRQLTLTLGARAFDSEFEKRDTTRVELFGIPIENPQTVVSEFDETGEIFKVHLAYDLNEDILLYGQVSEGFRPGGANQTVVGQAIPKGYESDSVTNYELGLRSSWLDGKLTLNTAVYHLVWDNIQVTGRTDDNLFGYLTNAGEAQVDGIELELSWLATNNLELAFTLNAVDARLTEDQPPANNDRAGLKGDDIPVVPDVTASLSAQYNWPLQNGLSLYLRGDVNYTGASNNNFRDYLIDPDPTSPTFGEETSTPNDRFAEMDAYAVTNLRFGLEGATWGIEAYVNNVEDERGETYHFVDNFRPAPGETFVIRPRTAGISLYKTF